jgi:hypothetical protein
MRSLIVLAVLLLSPPAQAQFSKQFEAGAYQLSDSPGNVQLGELSFRNHDKLLIKKPSGQVQSLKPTHVNRFTIGKRQYVAFKTVFPRHSHPEDADEETAFVEQLANGKLKLLRYDRTGNTGVDWLFLYHYQHTYYFLTNRQHLIDTQRYDRAARPNVVLSSYADSTVTLLQSDYRPNELASFYQAVKPFFTTRPDLLAMLREGQITIHNLPTALQALNENLPYSAPAGEISK